MKIAIVEDDKSIVNAISIAFEFRWPDADVVTAGTGKEGISLVKAESPNVVILDINLPDISGFEVLKNLRQFTAVPVIILTVRADDSDVLKGLEAGADDYIIKPFNYLTLLARVRAVLRRSEKVPVRDNYNIAMNPRLNIDFVNQKVTVDNHLVKLTPVEYQLLILLVKNKDTVVPYQQIMEDVWGKTLWHDTENLRIYVRRLRQKLSDIPPNMIINKHGAGYIFKS
jgi:two-component system, OmpR family, response regulator VicR